MTANPQLPKGILQRGKGYRVQVMVNGQRKTGTADTIEAAIELKQVLASGLKAAQVVIPTDIEESSWTFKEAVDKTLSIIWAGTEGERTSMINASTLMEYFGTDTMINTITLEQVDAFVAHCINEKGNSGATINRKMACLSRIMRTAHERGKIKVLFKMPRRSEGEHRVRFLSSQEEEQLKDVLKQVVSQDIQDAVLMLLYTGFRCGELWRLECRDIDLEQNTITAWKTKNKHPRTIPIVASILSIIKRRMMAIGGHGLLFPEGKNSWLRRPWAIIKHHMGMDGDEQFVPHMLRHTCATRLSQAGVTMPIIKEWMGHTTITTTARYAHFNPKDLHNAAKMLGGK